VWPDFWRLIVAFFWRRLVSMADRIQVWLLDNGFGNIVRLESVGGGCINNTTRLHLDEGKSVFLKQHDQAPDGMFRSEAVGLAALKQTNAIRVPEVIHVEDDYIILEDLGQGRPTSNYWNELGSSLANMHQRVQAQFGFSMDNFCGSTAQVNTPTEDGFEFFANYRILGLASSAFHRNLINRDDLNSLEFIAGNLSRWIPKQPAVPLHGDLWSGNIHSDEHGKPALIDPAAYWGWAEAELAMTTLFGGFSPAFYASYEENSEMAADWQERAPLYNLYHLLNHLLLFGSAYLAQIRSITQRFVD